MSYNSEWGPGTSGGSGRYDPGKKNDYLIKKHF